LNRVSADVPSTNVIFVADEKFDPKKHVKEYRCTCKECGTVWHYLASEESALKLQGASNALMGCAWASTSCSPISMIFSNKSIDTSRQLKKLSLCPNCNSSNIKKEEIFHEKR
jgi:hypothetical protein